jgi:hypothetical protein
MDAGLHRHDEITIHCQGIKQHRALGPTLPENFTGGGETKPLLFFDRKEAIFHDLNYLLVILLRFLIRAITSNRDLRE